MVNTFIGLIVIAVIGFPFQSVASNVSDREGKFVSFPLHVPKKQKWSFSGPFGGYDKAQLRRGLKVYKQVCSNCHGLKYVAFRNLNALGYDQEQIKAFAGQYEVSDGPNREGKFFKRAGVATDTFPSPFANEEEARFIHNGAYPPDLSLIARARTVTLPFPALISDILTHYDTAGPDYITALLTGYQKAPEGSKIAEGYWYNPYFIATDTLAMPPPLRDGVISYEDGIPETVEQYARDVSAFLMWAADPHMEIRKKTGFRVILFLIILGGLVYILKSRIWQGLEEKFEKKTKN
ncbi:ubiquinol-cytochrome c reductase cytochrome c1 subunit [Bartonella callosciuri]|uniref:Cytochrome c1 n=1 Tax=Bartonella callosciuri TaxID=686223 RepID=A0A840NMY1_9HYPH|nr:cytochrome c1 [Bartonella callosciuri]MBB5073230.1 ubiquinol-cytochrome c reductase cytochrome c1 subunit [Bartonella callosciuri]